MICPKHNFKYVRRFRPEVSPLGIIVWECVLCGVLSARYPEKLNYEECCWIDNYNNQLLLQGSDCNPVEII